jgi:hypothetical protein
MSFTGIFAPGGRLCSDTVPAGEEGIVYADCDIEAVIAPRLRHDLAGHYNRSDILTLNLNRAPLHPLAERAPGNEPLHAVLPEPFPPPAEG